MRFLKNWVLPLLTPRTNLLTKIDSYFDCTFVNPGFCTVIWPIQTHMVLLFWSIAGLPPILSFLATGAQGMMGRGMQRPGTKTGMGPIIFQFIGLSGDRQLPKAGIFNMGMISNWPAIDFTFEFITLAIGSTIIFFGPAPKVHFSLAPIQTHFGIRYFFSHREIWKTCEHPQATNER